MSDRPTADLDRDLTTRFVNALDQLAVPAGPGHLLPRAAQSRAPRFAFVVVVLLLAIALGVPQVRESIAGAFRWLEGVVGGPAWIGYYVEQAPFGSAAYQEGRVMFTSGRLPGSPTVVAGEFADQGPWSSDGNRILLSAGPAIYVGDRAGQVRKIAEVPNGFIRLARWLDSGDIIANVFVDGIHWITRFDVANGRTERRQLMANLEPQAPAAFSPNGEWLVMNVPTAGGRSCYGNASAVYDIGAQRTTQLLDPAGQPVLAIGWTRDGSLITAHCDRGRSQIEFFVARPETVLGAPFAVLPWVEQNPAPLMDRPRDRVLVSTQRGATPGVVSALSLDGRVIEVVRLPRLTNDEQSGDVQAGTLSMDGRYLSFRIAESGPDKIVRSRAGVIDVINGRVTYACDVDCARFSLR